MALAVALSRGLDGLNAPPVTVEVHLANGLPALTLVGLPDAEVREARDRVRAAIVNSGFEFPGKRTCKFYPIIHHNQVVTGWTKLLAGGLFG